MSKNEGAGNKTASFVVTQLQNLQAGLSRLGELDRQQRASQPDEAKLASVNTERDQLVAKLANNGFIDPTLSAEIRQSLDQPGGAEHLLSQMVDGASKEASSIEGQLGESASSKTATAAKRRVPPSQQRYHR